MALVVRSWNVFHGNTEPPGRRTYLEEMVRLVCSDGPGIVCLQEVPVRDLPRLGTWSGMTPFTTVAARPRFGSVRLGSVLVGLHAGLFSRWFSGDGNAILVDRQLEVLGEWVAEIGETGERRVCQAVRIAGLGLVGNFHATWRSQADEQFRRAVQFAESLAHNGESLVLCGDANVRPEHGGTYDVLRARHYSRPAAGSDQILVRPSADTEISIWPPDRRRSNGRLLSDHAPVELAMDV